MIPTPSARDWKGGAKMGRDTVDSLVEMGATKGQDGVKTGLKLLPGFAAWMMGYPENYTELPFLDGEKNLSKPTETQSSPKSHTKFSNLFPH